MFEKTENHIDSSLATLGNASQFLNNNSVNSLQADLTGFNSQRLLTLAGETLINAWQNQINPTQALVYTAASIFNPNFATNAQVAFGAAFDISKAEALGADILGGIYGVLPDVKFLSNAEMNGALGAYAKSTNTIYLNSVFLTQNAANPTAIGKVLVEETGHFLDVYANPIDSPGDEGDILARLTNNEEISNEAFKALKSEDDRGIVLLSQGSLEVEQALVSGNSLNNSLYGTSYADSIYGYAGNDYLSGGDGDDSLYGGDGNDVLDGGFGFDFLDGGNGIDQVTYNFYSGGINLSLQTGVVSFPGNSTRTDTVVNVEDVIGSSGNDTILGNALSNNLIGGNGDDIIRGGDGDDVLDGGFGFDFLDGGNGKDTVSYDFYNGGITLNLRTGVVSFPGNSTLTETVIGIEAVIGSRGNDFLTGDSFNNSLNGNSGNDVLDAYGSGLLERDDLLGGLGSDRFVLGDANNTYYTRSGSSDLAAIADFRVGEDTIQLRKLSNSVTSSSQAYGYRLSTVGNNTEIRLDNNELIAILNNVTGLNLTSSAFQFVGTVPPPDYAGNNTSTAYNIGVLNTSRSFSDWVGAADTNDYYRFSVGSQSNFSLSLTGLSADADVQFLDSSGNLITSSTNGGSSSESIIRQLSAGTYFARVYPFSDANTNYNLSLTANPIPNISFSSFNVFDAAGDSTGNSVFQGGAIQLNYGLSNVTSLSSVRLEALTNGSTINLGTWTGASLSNSLINLANFSSLTGGDYQFRAVARTTSGQDFFSSSQSMRILSWSQSSNTTYGTFAGETLNYSGGLGTGAVVVGRGGTDTLNLSGISRSNVTGINGVSLGSFNPFSSTNQAIFRGTTFDYLTLADGREIYLQGIENLRFSDGSTLDMQVRTNDTYFNSQWNLSVSDVGSAWRFTQGASNVLISSLDSGVLTATGKSGSVVDISTSSRLITDPTDDDNYNLPGHGHQSISIMSSTANNGSGIAGINWNSSVYVNDVYNGVSLQQAIRDTIAYARARNQRVVFQGGIQGEYWLNSGGTQAQLEQLIRDNSDIAIFAVAAGNGGIDIDNTDPNNSSVQRGLSGGVARLQTTYSNVMSVGALERSGQSTVNDLANATSVNKASYSNFGSSLTLMAATDSPAMRPDGSVNLMFNGTSAANPNMAGIASLVWSVNSSLNGGQLRQILIDTAMDLGATGRDNTFGNGLVNADAAVRRALALSRNSQLSNFYSGRSEFA